MKKNLVPLLGIAFVVAIVATGVFYGLFVSRIENASARRGPSVVVAARNLDRGAVLDQEDLRLVPWPSDETPDGVFSSIEAAAGKTILQPVLAHEPVLARRIAGGDGDSGVPRGMRGISITVGDSAGVVALLQPGHRVDIQVVTPPQQNVNPELRTLLQDIEVLAVRLAPDGREDPVVTTLVTPEQADMLALGDSGARLRLLLRHPLDQETKDLPRQSLPTVFRNPVPPNPPRP
ncbi:MAG: Flp pilus assembly protein CpaB [Bryobacterales bacterium]|nr:Flp pilus assembly protein CpaB [Bryobacterales bacterium]